MKNSPRFPGIARVPIALLAILACLPPPGTRAAGTGGEGPLNVLFVGNSFTARHNLAQVVKAMAEAGQPGRTFEVTTVIYGGRTLKDHWRLGTQNFVRLADLTAAEEQATLQSPRWRSASAPPWCPCRWSHCIARRSAPT